MAKAEKKPVEGKKIGNLEIDNTFTPVTYDPQYILMVNKWTASPSTSSGAPPWVW